jgi:ElaB/YqjD/DUF883 family membrane-anchored ribosome-binding protein
MQSSRFDSNAAKGAMQDDLKPLKDVSSSVNEKVMDFGSSVSAATSNVVDTVSKEARNAADYASQAIDKIPGYVNMFEQRVRKHPWMSAAISAGIGAAAVTYLTRSKSARTQH